MGGLNAGEVYAILGGRFNPAGFHEFGGAMRRSRDDAALFEKRVKDSTDRSSRAFHAMGTAAKVMGVGVAAAGVTGVAVLATETLSAVKAAASFEAAMRNVNSIAKLSEPALKGVSKAVLSMAGRTGQAPKVLAEGLYDIVSSGFKAHDALKILEASSTAATAGLTDTATSTKAVVAVLNSYGLGADQAGKVSDQLFQIVNSGVITFDELAGQIGDVLPFAASLGLGLDQLGGAIATITKGGTPAAQTMTEVKGIFNQMLSPSAALQKAIKATGESSAEALLKHKGLQGSLEALMGTTDGSKAAVQRLFPDVQALGGVLALTGKKAKGAEADLASMAEAGGSTKAAFAEQSKSYEVSAQKFGAAWQAAKITVGEQVLPVLTQKLGDWSKGLSAAIDSGELQKFGDDVAKGTDVALHALQALAQAAPGIVHSFASSLDGALGVLTTIDDAIILTLKSWNDIPLNPLKVDTSELQRGVDNINAFRESLRRKTPPVKVYVQGEVDDAAAALKRIQGTKIERKVMKILGEDSSARHKFNALEALKIPPKDAEVLANIGSALRGISTVNGALAQLPRFTQLEVAIHQFVTGTPLSQALKGPSALTPKPRKAAGRGPGRSEQVLVGENPNNPREAIVDPSTGRAMVVNGPAILDLPDTAYVIPEDGRYRTGALGLLAMLAGDLGLRGFKKGTAPKKKAAKQHRYVPTHIDPLAFPEEDFNTKENAARTSLNEAKRVETSETKAIKSKQAQIRDIERRKPKTKDQKANQRDDLKRARHDLATAKTKLAKAKSSIPTLRAEWQERKRELAQAKKYAAEIKRLTDVANTDADLMTLADRNDDDNKYESARKDRLSVLGARKAILVKAQQLAQAAGNIGYATALGSDIAGLDVDIASTTDQKQDLSPAEQAAQDAADRFGDTGMTDAERARLSEINRDIALAALTDTLDDDTARAGDLVSFLEGVLQQDVGPRHASADAITAVAEQLRSAKQNLASFTGGTTNDNPDLQAQVDQANERARVATESARVNAAALAVFGGGGDISQGGANSYMAARGTVVYQTINTLHPGDSRTIAAIGAVATAGQDQQGARISPRVGMS